jgi:hypothetical protein
MKREILYEAKFKKPGGLLRDKVIIGKSEFDKAYSEAELNIEEDGKKYECYRLLE